MTRTRLSVLAVIGVSVAGLSAQAKRPMAIDDLLGALRISDPQLSPDNRRVLYVRTATNITTGKRNADIWMVPADGSGASSEFIVSAGSESSPRFLPDSGRVAFLSSRDGDTQVYVADPDGRNARAITNVAGGVQPPLVVSPDGKMVAFVVDVDPACPDEECNKRKRAEKENDPVKVRRLTSLPFRHWDEWREGVRHHVFVANVDAGSAVRDLTPGDFDSPPHNYEDAAITFSPDGRSLLFVSNREGRDREMWTTNHDVWSVPVTGGSARKITNNAAADVQPVFSADGTTLAVRSQRRPGFESDRWYVDLMPVQKGDGGINASARRTLFPTTDISAEDLRFSQDGKSIWFTSGENATENLYVASVTGGAPRVVSVGGAISGIQIGTDFVVYVRSSLTSPPDLFRVSADGTTSLRLTNEHASWQASIQMPAVETNQVPLKPSGAVQYWLIKPPNFDPTKKYPTVFLIHGGPQGAWLDGWSSRWNPALWASQGWVVVAPNPRGSTGFGQQFVDEVSKDWCGKAMTDLTAVFDAVGKLPFVDTGRQGIAGASYGGYAVDWIIGHSNRFKAAVSHDGVFNLESMAFTTEELWFVDWDFGGAPWTSEARKNFARCSPHLSADKIKTPTLVITNEQDFRVPVDQGLQLFTALRRNGVPAEALIFQNEGHWVLGALNSRRWHESVFGWMKKYLAN